MAKVERWDPKTGQLWIEKKIDLKEGDSLAINGSCLSLVAEKAGSQLFQLSPETIVRTNWRFAQPGDELNLEKPLTLADPLGGHLVTGHIDGVATILEMHEVENNNWHLKLEVDPQYSPYIVEKGSVTLNGISLTLNEVSENAFQVMIIPITWEKTNLKTLSVGSKVNVEWDYLTKMVYRSVEKILAQSPRATPGVPTKG